MFALGFSTLKSAESLCDSATNFVSGWVSWFFRRRNGDGRCPHVHGQLSRMDEGTSAEA